MPWREWPWERIAALVLSPGVPLTHPRPHGVVEHANRAHVPVIGDVELFAREIQGKAPLIAITGTNGKSTTTALVGHILNACGFDAQVGGNIGKSVLELSLPTAKTVYVLEMSSFQIDLAPGLVPDVAILSNLSPDHIDRHGTMENYAAIKARMLAGTSKTGQMIIGVDDDWSSSIFTRLSAAGGATAQPVSVGKVLGARHLRGRWRAVRRHPGPRREGDGDGRGAAPARRPQLAECGAGLWRGEIADR